MPSVSQEKQFSLLDVYYVYAKMIHRRTDRERDRPGCGRAGGLLSCGDEASLRRKRNQIFRKPPFCVYEEGGREFQRQRRSPQKLLLFLSFLAYSRKMPSLLLLVGAIAREIDR